MKLIHHITATKHWAGLGSHFKYRWRRIKAVLVTLVFATVKHINTQTFISISDFLCTVTYHICHFYVLSCVCVNPLREYIIPLTTLRVPVWPWLRVCIPRHFSSINIYHIFYVEVNKFAADQLFMSSWTTATHTHANIINTHFRP